MDKEDADCNELIVRTSQALNDDTLRLFCLSILRNDIDFRIKHVINRWETVATLPMISANVMSQDNYTNGAE